MVGASRADECAEDDVLRRLECLSVSSLVEGLKAFSSPWELEVDGGGRFDGMIVDVEEDSFFLL